MAEQPDRFFLSLVRLLVRRTPTHQKLFLLKNDRWVGKEEPGNREPLTAALFRRHRFATFLSSLVSSSGKREDEGEDGILAADKFFRNEPQDGLKLTAG